MAGRHRTITQTGRGQDILQRAERFQAPDGFPLSTAGAGEGES